MRNNLSELRSAQGWTQVDLARRVGVSRQTIISIERGKYDPSLPLAFRIAAIFRAPLEAIFIPDGAGPAKAAQSESDPSPAPLGATEMSTGRRRSVSKTPAPRPT